ncbi:PREDICTED: polygalacturonase inhibitor-like [Tarenaya hassleriana]|uniref:polygalacturonase inhibitor-like n=1 Tax=Tarenaya hassleriana TaxID=28532 RepID=UPI00053C0C4C|nr:PREDICTED: polygalacturonase inhibitor-like [Tarenaya hassleriana]
MKLLFFSIFFFFVSPSASCNPNDKKALLQIKKSLNYPQILHTWDPKTDCCTNWTGVECTRRRVTSLLIQAGEVSGEIPPEIGDLPFLRYLDFNNLDDLTGNIPRTITKLKYLDTLRFRGTKLSGSVPDFISELKEVTFLDLSFNEFSGSIPGSLSKMPKLQSVQLNDNRLTGSVPESFGSFEGNVPDLYLNSNQLSGNIPESWSENDFGSIFLSENGFSGDGSMIFGGNKTTARVDLSKNNFRFNLSKVKFAKSLVYLDLSHNQIYGTLPSELRGLALEQFNVSYNRLCGRIPRGGTLQKFDAFAFSNNLCLCGPPLNDC